jgi:serine/threonine-protein kinase
VTSWPTEIAEDIESWVGYRGSVSRRFGDRVDSRSVVLGVQRDGGRYIIKAANDPEAVAWLESAERFHRSVHHAAIAKVLASIRTPTGLALVEEWAYGDVLVDDYDPTVPSRDVAASPYQRFRSLPPGRLATAIAELIGAHVAVAKASYVAVDLYDGCVVYDFEHDRLSLIDLDHYRPGPYVLEFDRQLGSSSYQPPEEFQQGATIDERATVFTLGRMTLVYLGCDRKSPPSEADFRGTPEQFSVATKATAARPSDRIPSVRALHDAWMATLPDR